MIDFYKYSYHFLAEAKKLKQDVSIGQEMMAHHRENHPFPTVVEIKSDDSLAIKRVKRIIRNMTKFKPLDRKSIAEVEQEMGGIYYFYA